MIHVQKWNLIVLLAQHEEYLQDVVCQMSEKKEKKFNGSVTVFILHSMECKSWIMNFHDPLTTLEHNSMATFLLFFFFLRKEMRNLTWLNVTRHKIYMLQNYNYHSFEVHLQIKRCECIGLLHLLYRANRWFSWCSTNRWRRPLFASNSWWWLDLCRHMSTAPFPSNTNGIHPVTYKIH